MLEAHSPLGAVARFECDGVVLTEAPDFTLLQVAGADRHLKKAFGKIPTKNGVVSSGILRVAPKQLWLLDQKIEASEGLYVTPLSSSRTRIHLEGFNARRVLAAVALIDFGASQFKPGQFVMTGIHHTPVTIHCISENSFHIYALRTFALNVWEWLCDIAEGLDHA
jgi:heterotetrameric sarcosine oxidase gamma subunit